ncbi:hypothetical protein EPK99_06390 [Neorhizobium lilium]|uniref:Lipoprotein n=1 Tax=Neorhizobium lilium TaxID=2503024 RepID=A0A444LGW1_9HYPH|nr:hypothetical protein [Neorhizobium lilium]RWX78258.1 hypothetical protein EPK99_06390 [Neorhizobium lilium]
MKHRIIILLSTGFLASCGTIVVPAAGVSSTGEQYRGTASGSATSGTFELTGTSGNKCSGTYDPLSSARKMIVPVTCTNCQSGSLDINRDPDLMGGEGTGTFSDGTTSTFQFGKKRVPA